MTAILLFAAGFGTRMGALTRDRPKPLIEVAGQPLIDHALDLAGAAGCAPVVANLHYKADMLAAYLEPLGVRLSREAPEILETGGGLRAALPLLGDDPVMTLNTDAIWSGPNPLDLLRRAWDPDRMDALLMCVPVARAEGHAGPGDFTADAQGRIRRGPGLIYGGAQILKTGELPEIPDRAFSLNQLWNRMQARGRLYALEYPGRWCDVGRPEGIALAEGLLADV
ncbi:MurNAc alpha-1-phosphate uridylyltransferase [Cribrihabitans marinus]|uniref:MurNAc alpha-1-phosphate uridylyltransferase n=1 Tax=Cribrihabitans marinus TaxID=1227549 RepID=A0A1H6YHY4_9RHOB|nr:nucleotidyltransferase family protein [Cribrihabitans marinus]GGH29280.1 nucleotidyltransferase [Cribrihabitans marinus]SEJ40881.1 MurNAc alpha-1-phosphate uridylyltransferase [Cribrihabitans marinus]